MVDLPGPALISSTSEHSSARGPTPTQSPAPPQPPVKPDYSSFSAFGSSHPAPKASTPQPSLFQQKQALQQAAPTKQQTPALDPFAALASPLRQSTPQQASPSMFDFGNSQSPAPAPALISAPAPLADDDEWAFSSALPEGLPSSNTISVSQTSLAISLHAAREPQTPTVITMSLSFSNKTDQEISELTFMADVTKVKLHHTLCHHRMLITNRAIL